MGNTTGKLLHHCCKVQEVAEPLWVCGWQRELPGWATGQGRLVHGTERRDKTRVRSGFR